MSYVLDVEQFIREIKKHPEIWDLTCEDNRHKNRKQQAWTEVARLFISQFDDLPEIEKDDVYRKLHNKWRNIRDSFVRHIKRPDGKKGYMYAKQLSFLKAVYNVNTGSESEENDSNSNSNQLWGESDDDRKIKNKRRCLQVLNDCNWSDEEQPSTIDHLKRKRVSNTPTVQNVKTEQAIEFVDAPPPFPETSFAVEDDDRSFFESLLPAVRAFNLDQKLEFRSEVITLVKNIRNSAQNKTKNSSS